MKIEIDRQRELEQYILTTLEQRRLTGEQEVFLTYTHILGHLGKDANTPLHAQQWAAGFADCHMVLSSPRGNGIWFANIF